MLHRFTSVMQNLVIHDDNMLKDTKLYGGVIFSQKIMLKLVEKKGYTREEAYRLVQKHALSALNGGNFKEELKADKDVALTEDELEECFSTSAYLTNIPKIFKRFE